MAAFADFVKWWARTVSFFVRFAAPSPFGLSYAAPISGSKRVRMPSMERACASQDAGP